MSEPAGYDAASEPLVLASPDDCEGAQPPNATINAAVATTVQTTRGSFLLFTSYTCFL